MANLDAPRGFQLVNGGGKGHTRRQQRVVDASNTLTLAPGDAYTIEADGNIARVDGGTLPINGIVESFEVQAKSGQGPESIDYLPASTAASVIGIEDADAEFEVQIDTVAQADFDTGKLIDIVDTAPDATLRQSRQTVAVATGDQLKLIRLVDRINNDLGANAKVIVKLIPASVM